MFCVAPHSGKTFAFCPMPPRRLPSHLPLRDHPPCFCRKRAYPWPFGLLDFILHFFAKGGELWPLWPIRATRFVFLYESDSVDSMSGSKDVGRFLCISFAVHAPFDLFVTMSPRNFYTRREASSVDRMVRFGNEFVSFILRLSDRENAYQRRRPFPFAYTRSTASSVVLRGSNFPTYPLSSYAHLAKCNGPNVLHLLPNEIPTTPLAEAGHLLYSVSLQVIYPRVSWLPEIGTPV